MSLMIGYQIMHKTVHVIIGIYSLRGRIMINPRLHLIWTRVWTRVQVKRQISNSRRGILVHVGQVATTARMGSGTPV